MATKAIEITYTDNAGVSHEDSYHVVEAVNVNKAEREAAIAIKVYSSEANYQDGYESIEQQTLYLTGDNYDNSVFAETKGQGTTAPDSLLYEVAQEYLMTLTEPYNYFADGTALES